MEHSLPATCVIQIALERERAVVPTEALPAVHLSDAEERAFKQYRFKSRLIIQVTGQMEGRKSNIVKIGGAEVVLPDASLRLFLRLVVALYETEDGFLSRDALRHGEGLDSELALAPEGLDQALSRIRVRIRPALSGLKPTEFVEVSRKRIRLSTHKRYAFFERRRLASHPDEVIRSLAIRLPAANAARRRAPTPA